MGQGKWIEFLLRLKDVLLVSSRFVVLLSSFKMPYNVPALGEVANFGTDYFLSKIKFLARNKRVFTTKFAILPNACYMPFLSDFY
jgi:hypothetical protein